MHLPALQPVVTQLQSLELSHSRLEGSADGFLTAGWTALTSVSLFGSNVLDDVLTALNLPALEVLSTYGFAHQGGVLRPEQLCCPQLCSLEVELDSSLAQDSEGSRQCCSLLSLARLTTLTVKYYSNPGTMDLALPASFKRLTVQDKSKVADIKWVLLQAAKCIRGGAQLRFLTYTNFTSALYFMRVPWGASTIAPYKEIGEQLSGLEDLSASSNGPDFLSAVGAVACSAPSLTRLKFSIQGPTGITLPPICSASLKSITGLYRLRDPYAPPPLLAVILTFLPGCTQLREVHVQYFDAPKEGAYVKIRCHCNSQRYIVPFVAEFDDELPWNRRSGLEEVGVRFMPTPASPQGVQPYTVLFACHAAGPEQAPKWGHVVMPGVL